MKKNMTLCISLLFGIFLLPLHGMEELTALFETLHFDSHCFAQSNNQDGAQAALENGMQELEDGMQDITSFLVFNRVVLQYHQRGLEQEVDIRNRALLKWFERSGFDVNVRSTFGRTPLMVAAYCGNIEVVKWLLEHGADAAVQDSDGNTAEMWAAKDIEKLSLSNSLKAYVARRAREQYCCLGREFSSLIVPFTICASLIYDAKEALYRVGSKRK